MVIRLSILSVTTWGMPLADAARYSARFSSMRSADTSSFSFFFSISVLIFFNAALDTWPGWELTLPRLLYLSPACLGSAVFLLVRSAAALSMPSRHLASSAA